MANETREDVLIKVVLIQQQMIEDFRALNNKFRVALETMCGLDTDFRDIYFAQILASDSSDLPGPVPDRQTLTEALQFLGWTSHHPEQLKFWCSFHNHVPNPWNRKLPGVLQSPDSRQDAMES